MEYLNGPHLFDSMFADDAEASKLAHLPGMPALLETYPYPPKHLLKIRFMHSSVLCVYLTVLCFVLTTPVIN